MSAICVNSEINPLKKVLLHRPGRELLNVTPASLERLLFDDIPYLAAAQREHDRFAAVLRENGAEVVYLEDLAAESLAQSEDIRRCFIEQYIAEAGIYAQKYRPYVFDLLMKIPCEKELVLKTMEGITLNELDESAHRFLENCFPAGGRSGTDKTVIDPMPNLYFTRDTMVVIGEHLCINSMYSVTRRRETLYGAYVFDYHPDFKGRGKRCYGRSDPLHIEGGDVTNLTDTVIAVGVSERTCADAVEALARNLFADKDCAVDTVLAFTIPAKRAFMHLDTVFTQVDKDLFVVHPGILSSLEIFEIRVKQDGGTGRSDEKLGCAAESIELTIRKTEGWVEHILAHYTGVDSVRLILCGGGSPIIAEREQWNDGSNTLCAAPGTAVVYSRNEVTNELLDKAGVKLCLIPDSELSRGRGGPRCMSMPLIRQ